MSTSAAGSTGTPGGGGSGGGIYPVDSSVLVRSLRGDPAIQARSARATALYVSSIVLGELYYGAYGSPTRAAADVLEVDRLAHTLAVLDVDAITATTYGRIKRAQRVKGQMLPDNDLWIAASAIQYGLTLAARDVHVDWIDGLSCEQW